MANDPRGLPKRSRLSDLYRVGKKEILTDGVKEIEAWVQKISPLDQRKAMDMAHAARSKVMAAKNAPDDDERRQIVETEAEWDGFDADRDQMIQFLIMGDVAKSRASHQSEVASEEEWSKNDYYNGLREAWDGGLNETFNLDPDDKEARQVRDELLRYMEIVDKRVEKDRRSLARGYATFSDEKLKRKVIDGLIEAQGDEVWVEEFRKAQLYFAVRDPEDNTELFMSTPDEIDDMDPRIVRQLFEAMDGLMVEPAEGKD